MYQRIEFFKKTRGEQYFFVNKRFIKAPYLHHAVTNSVEGLLQQKMFLSYFIFLELDTTKIDINVHPSKNEIKIRNEREIFSQVEKTIRSNLINYNTNKNDISSEVRQFDFNVVEKQTGYDSIRQFSSKSNFKDYVNKKTWFKD